MELDVKEGKNFARIKNIRNEKRKGKREKQ